MSKDVVNVAARDSKISSPGNVAISNFLPPDHEAKVHPIPMGPLDLVLCLTVICSVETPSNGAFVIFTSTGTSPEANQTMIAALQDVVDCAQGDVSLTDPTTDSVLDIGAMMERYSVLQHESHIARIAFEPAKNICQDLRKKDGDEQLRGCVVNDFFSLEAWSKIKNPGTTIPNKVKVVTSHRHVLCC